MYGIETCARAVYESYDPRRILYSVGDIPVYIAHNVLLAREALASPRRLCLKEEPLELLVRY